MRKLTVCVDLDGVLAYYDQWRGFDHIGDPIPGAKEFVRRLSEKYKVVIHTSRLNAPIPYNKDVIRRMIADWLKKHEIYYDDIECKPLAVAYIDDRAILCTPQRQVFDYNNALECVDMLVSVQ